MPAGNSFYAFRSTVLHDGVDIGAQRILEKIAIALFQSEFVVMNDDKTVHTGIMS